MNGPVVIIAKFQLIGLLYTSRQTNNIDKVTQTNSITLNSLSNIDAINNTINIRIDAKNEKYQKPYAAPFIKVYSSLSRITRVFFPYQLPEPSYLWHLPPATQQTRSQHPHQRKISHLQPLHSIFHRRARSFKKSQSHSPVILARNLILYSNL